MPDPVTGFTKSGITADELREEELYGVLIQAAGEAAALSPHALWKKLRAAEDSVEKDLQIFLGPRRIASNAQARGLDPATYDLDEPALDWDPDNFRGERWGEFHLPYRPVQALTNFFFSFPGMAYQPTQVPASWIQLDRKFGLLELVPMTGQESIQLWQPLLQIIGAGRRIPKVVFVDYTAGLTPTQLSQNHADLLEYIRLAAVLMLFGILTTVRTGGLGSQSLSLDGLSRSESFNSGKWGPYSGAVELALARMKDIRLNWVSAERGVVLA